MSKLVKGDKAPDFELQDQSSTDVKLSGYRGRKVLLYFYPRAETPGCTVQSCSVRDARDEMAELGVAVIGISPDLPKKQASFDNKHNLRFPLLSDPEHKAADAYGVWGEKKMAGKKYMGIIRSSFLIDEKGKIIEAWYKVSPKDTVPNAMKALKETK
ncbi:MAG: thioredoxin-dependent thiol peroxidase [Fibrobacter sp.]|nr:thioredoxin-dependent thiol peroxidase [Fibrobacter sp.]